MQALSPNDIIDFVEAIAIKNNEPVFIWGKPGIGKSAIMKQLTKRTLSRSIMDLFGVTKKTMRLVDIRLSQYDSVDLRGIPDVQNGRTVWNVPSTMPFEGNDAFPDDELIVLFFDEMNAATPAVSAVAYQIIHDRACGEHNIKRNVVIVGAGNREGDKGVVNRMPLPLANRMTHIEAEVSVDSWSLWAQNNDIPPEGIAFINFRKIDVLNTFDPSKPEKAFATPRTWEKALKYYRSDIPMHLKQAAMAGAVGDGPAAEFWGFVDVWSKMISLDKIEKNPDTVDVPTDAAMRYAMTMAISGSLTAKNIAAFYVYLKRMPAEFPVLAMQMAMKRDDKLFATPTFVSFAKDYKAIFQA